MIDGALVVQVVEDSPDLRFLIRFNLEAAGLRVLSVDDDDWARMLTIEAWEDVDVAVVDLNLSSHVINGVHILLFLRDTLPTVRRVVFTASVHPDGEDRAYREVAVIADAFVSKFDLASKLIPAVTG